MRTLLKVTRAIAGWGDPISRDLSRSGDLFVAQFRLGLLMLLALIPMTSSLVNPGQVENWLGLATIGVALAFAVWEVLWFYAPVLCLRDIFHTFLLPIQPFPE